MSDTPYKGWRHLTPAGTSEEINEYIAQRKAEIAAEAAVEAAAKRQKQKDLIKEAILEALNGPEETKQEISEHPVKLRASIDDLWFMTPADKYQLTRHRADGTKVELPKPAGTYQLGWVPQGYFARLWAALRGK